MKLGRILIYELRYWVRNPVFYVFASLFFTIGFAMMIFSADIVGEQLVSKGTKPFANNPLNLFSFFFDTQLFVLFLIPIFIGGSIYRDFQSNTFNLLYSFPVAKQSYLTEKFLSGSLMVGIILLLFCLGLFLGTLIPGVNPNLVGSNSLSHYLSPLFWIALFNLLWIGIIVFSVVSLSRSIHAGFITVILLFVLRRAMLFIFSGPENMDTITLLDPFGEATVMISTGSWTVSEINSSLIPISIELILNRAIWLAIALAIGCASYLSFELNHAPIQLRIVPFRRNPGTKRMKTVHTTWSTYSLFPIWLQTSLELSKFQFRAIIKSRTFIVLIIVSLLFMILLLGQVNPEYTTRIYPLTQVMLLLPSLFFSFIVMLITFLYAGFLVHKDNRATMNALVDASSVPSASLLVSKLLTLLKLQVVLLSLIIIGGISVQLWKGYIHLELQQYFIQVYGLLFIGQIIWAIAALFIQTVIPNQYLGFFILILFSFGLSGIESIGIEKGIFIFNGGIIPQYSDLSGYDSSIRSFLVHKVYWFVFGILLLILSYLFAQRGLVFSIRERFIIARKRITKKVSIYLGIIIFAFIALGTTISLQVYPSKAHTSGPDLNQRKVDAEDRIGHLEHILQPELSAISLSLDIYPEQKSFSGTGSLLLINNSAQPIDTLMLSYPTGVRLRELPSRAFQIFDSDTILNYEVLVLNEQLQSGDSIEVRFTVAETPENWFSEKQKVVSNGTFFLADFPLIGYPDVISSKKNIPPDELQATKNSYVGKHVGLMDTDFTISTSLNQLAFAPGILQERWEENGRSFYHYKSEKSIRNGIPIQSGSFEVFEDSVYGIDLKIYYHSSHTFNLDRMMTAMKATIDYSTTHFGPYPFEELRIIEFSRSYGNFAQSFAYTLPFSEAAGFFSKQDSSENRFDDVFRLTAHEVAHQWWGHQIIPAEALGSRFLTEAFAEFTAVQILEQEYGTEKKQLYLDLIRNRYFNQRGRASKESPLTMAKPDEALVTYSKGLLALQSLNDHLEPGAFSDILRKFFYKYARNEDSYPTSHDFIAHLEQEVPDSLTYLITDLFKEVTLYESLPGDYQVQKQEDDSYKIEVDLLFEKFRNHTPGMEITALPLKDFVEIEVYDNTESVIAAKTIQVNATKTTITLTTGVKPQKIILDPHRKLIEQNYSNNTIIIGEQ